MPSLMRENLGSETNSLLCSIYVGIFCLPTMPSKNLGGGGRKGRKEEKEALLWEEHLSKSFHLWAHAMLVS